MTSPHEPTRPFEATGRWELPPAGSDQTFFRRVQALAIATFERLGRHAPAGPATAIAFPNVPAGAVAARLYVNGELLGTFPVRDGQVQLDPPIELHDHETLTTEFFDRSEGLPRRLTREEAWPPVRPVLSTPPAGTPFPGSLPVQVTLTGGSASSNRLVGGSGGGSGQNVPGGAPANSGGSGYPHISVTWNEPAATPAPPAPIALPDPALPPRAQVEHLEAELAKVTNSLAPDQIALVEALLGYARQGAGLAPLAPEQTGLEPAFEPRPAEGPRHADQHQGPPP